VNQGLEFAAARPGQRQRLERLQDPAQFRAWTLGTPRDQRHPAMPGRQRFDDQTGLAIGIGVQDECLLVVAALALLSHCQ
jgi:hypothetical protein